METAEDFLEKKDKEINNEAPSRETVKEWLIEFAKMHIEEAILQITENYDIYEHEDDCGRLIKSIDPYSIEKAYPLNNVV